MSILGLFCLGGSFVFAAMYSNLGNNLTEGTFSVQFPFGISILAGFLHIGASALTAVASVKAARHSYDDDDDDEDFKKWVAENHRDM